MTRAEILDKAKEAVTERTNAYGDAEDNFQTIANLWNDYLSGSGRIADISNVDVAVMLALLKIARISSGHGKADNFIDGAGYFACGGALDTKKGD